jgi:hypothetical protein
MLAGRMLGMMSYLPEGRTKNLDIGTGMVFLNLEILS